MSEHFLINGLGGKRTLEGEIVVRGAKNAVLPGMAASLLYRDPLTLTNVPEIEDVSRMSELLSGMGATVERRSGSVAIDARKVADPELTEEISKRLRASIIFIGPMLARFRAATFPHPGGCVLGARPIDLFVEGLEKMGAVFAQEGKRYRVRAPEGLHGADFFFRVPSVTGTETIMLAAAIAKGTTIIRNAAMEPEIVWLSEILNASGAKIEGAGTPTVTVRGTNGRLLSAKGKRFAVVPDRIEAGSFLLLGALAGKELTIANIEPKHLDALSAMLEYSGLPLAIGKRAITVRAPKAGKVLRSVDLKTHEYPGFPTDLQSPMVVYLTQTTGESLVFETIFEGRLNYTESLARMGASIAMMDPHRVLVKGPTKLSGKTLESPDIRAGLAYILAAAIAEGPSRIHNVYYIDRGYAHVEERLRAVGLDILRIPE